MISVHKEAIQMHRNACLRAGSHRRRNKKSYLLVASTTEVPRWFRGRLLLLPLHVHMMSPGYSSPVARRQSCTSPAGFGVGFLLQWAPFCRTGTSQRGRACYCYWTWWAMLAFLSFAPYVSSAADAAIPRKHAQNQLEVFVKGCRSSGGSLCQHI